MSMSGVEVEKTFIVENDPVSVNYYQHISANRDTQLFTSPWGGCVIKNCNDGGELLEFSSINEYEKSKKESKLWLYMPLKVFKFNELQLFGVYVCPECESMLTTKELESSQEPDDIKQILCLHSRVASMLMADWRTLWDINLSPADQVFNFCANQDEKFVSFIPQSIETALLAAVLHNNQISLLYCVTKRQESPFCSSCVRRKCHHYKKLMSHETDGLGGVSDDVQVEDELGGYEPLHDVEEEEYVFEDHYLKPPPNHIRGYLYG